MIEKKTKKTTKRRSYKKKIKAPTGIPPGKVYGETMEITWRGTPYEEKILKICSKNNLPFDFRRAKIKGKVADFICREKRLIIEIYNPERSDKEVYERMKIFKIQRFKTFYITKYNLSNPKWEKFCMGIIKGFLT